jgi:MoaA/NifB/PqqE/SkfB family radical SAM enzyme
MRVSEARPLQPERLPMRGDDNSAWLAWRDACKACEHYSAKYGCVRLGVVVYSNGAERGLPICMGGCKAWSPAGRAVLKEDE